MRKPAEYPQDIFPTNHLDAAAYLLTVGFELAGLEGDGSNVSFLFLDPEHKASAETLKYHQGAQVPAKLYAANQRTVRDLVWERRNGAGR